MVTASECPAQVNGTTWFEAFATPEGLLENLYVPNRIESSQPEEPEVSEHHTVWVRDLGVTSRWARAASTTSRTIADIEEFNRRWLERFPIYWPMSTNCQR